MDDPQLPPELVAEYVTRLGAVRHELSTLLASPGGTDQIRRLAHQLRGSGASYGFPEVTAHAARVEDAPPAELAARTRELITHLAGTSPAAHTHVLVVDDDPVITGLLAGILTAPGREIHVAKDAAEAEAFLAQGRIALVLLDLFLADEDGRRLLKQWRAAPVTRNTPIFILSATLGPEIKTECFTLGADGYFEKPFDPEMLAAMVTSTLERRSSNSSSGTAGPPPSPATMSAAVAIEGPRAILIADDDPLIASIVRHRLQKEGHRVGHAADGAAALESLTATPPDLLILDIKMPALDGFGVLRQVREDPTLKKLPVIILTALGEETDVVRGFSLGADDYLVKPFSPTELAVRVDRLLRRP